MIRRVITSFFLILSMTVYSQNRDHFVGLRLYTENDFLSPFARNYDDNYTGGGKLEIIMNTAGRAFKSKILNPLNWQPHHQNFSFTVTAFTPTNLADSNIVLSERPYASYQSINLGGSFLNEDKTEKYGCELSIGVMGEDIAGNAQTTVHDEGWFGTTRPVPLGWKYQIANGGAFAANLRITFEKIFKIRTEPSRWFNTSWRHELNFGQYMINYTQGVRLYIFNLNNSPLLEEGEPEIPTFHSNNTNVIKRAKRFGMYVFVTPKIKAVLHNSTLTGNLLGKSSVHKLSNYQVNKAVLEYDAGLQFRIFFLRLGYNFYGRSREYDNEQKQLHNWAGPYIGLIYRFD